MADRVDSAELLAGAGIGDEVAVLRPDYRVMLLVVEGLDNSPGDASSDALLTRAEERARDLTDGCAVEELPHIAAWREAYRSFGAKPQRTRNSVEALTRRAGNGLPRVNRLTDVYNAVSVLHQIPIGGEDADRYVGPPRLVRASGTEPFDTMADGAPLVEHPEPGEVVWADDAAVTCRRWNWRQGDRTRIRAETTRVLFVLDALEPVTDAELGRIGDELVDHLVRLGPDVRHHRRLLRATGGHDAEV